MAAAKKSKKSSSGSPTPGEPEYLLVGVLRRPHGLGGEMLMQVVTDFPERIESKLRVFLGESRTPAVVSSRRNHQDGVLIKFEKVDTPEAAGRLRNQSVYVAAADRPRLPRGFYYHHQLLGADVIDVRRGSVGILDEILQTGANDVYVVKMPSGGEILVPVLASTVLEIDVDRRQIRVALPEGL